MGAAVLCPGRCRPHLFFFVRVPCIDSVSFPFIAEPWAYFFKIGPFLSLSKLIRRARSVIAFSRPPEIATTVLS